MKKIPTWAKILGGAVVGGGLVAGLSALFGKKDNADEEETSDECDDCEVDE